MMSTSTHQSPGRETGRGLGLPASLPIEVVEETARGVAAAGYSSFWLNNPPNADGLQKLGRAAGVVGDLWLGVGVIPLSATGPDAIEHDLREYGLPLDRFYLGLGSGSGAGGVERVAEGIAAIRAQVDCTIVVAALGPRMSRLAGREADGVLLNWLTPEHARASIEWVRDAAEGAGRPMPRLMAYVRAALGAEATERLRKEAGNYEQIPHYAAHFTRMGLSAMDTAVTGSSRDEIQQRLRAWDGVVDEVVVRAVAASDSPDDILEIVQAASPEKTG